MYRTTQHTHRHTTGVHTETHPDTQVHAKTCTDQTSIHTIDTQTHSHTEYTQRHTGTQAQMHRHTFATVSSQLPRKTSKARLTELLLISPQVEGDVWAGQGDVRWPVWEGVT